MLSILLICVLLINIFRTHEIKKNYYINHKSKHLRNDKVNGTKQVGVGDEDDVVAVKASSVRTLSGLCSL